MLGVHKMNASYTYRFRNANVIGIVVYEEASMWIERDLIENSSERSRVLLGSLQVVGEKGLLEHLQKWVYGLDVRDPLPCVVR